MFIAALFIITRIWKQLRCSSVGASVNNLCYINTMEYYSSIKITLSSHEMIWRNQNCLLLSKRRQSEKIIYCKIPTIYCYRKTKL